MGWGRNSLCVCVWCLDTVQQLFPKSFLSCYGTIFLDLCLGRAGYAGALNPCPLVFLASDAQSGDCTAKRKPANSPTYHSSGPDVCKQYTFFFQNLLVFVLYMVSRVFSSIQWEKIAIYSIFLEVEVLLPF